MSFRSFPLRSTAPQLARSSARGRLILFLGVLAVSVGSVLLSGPYAFDRIVVLQLALVFGLGFLLFLFQYAQAGLALLLVGGLVVNFEIGTGTESRVNAAILLSPVLIGVWLLQLIFKRERHHPVFSRATLPLYLFMTTVLLALVIGQYPWFPVPRASMTAQLAQVSIFIFSGGLFLITAHQLQDVRWLRGITFLFIGLGSIHLLDRLLPGMLIGLSDALPQDVTSGSMFWTWLVALSFGQAIMNRGLNPLGRLALASVALTAVGFGLTQMTDWASGWFPALLSVFVILLLRFPIPILAMAPALVVLVLLNMNHLATLASAGDNVYSYQTRVAAIQSLLPLLTANPLLGLGPANYYHYTLLYPILGWYVKFNSHNNYLDLIGQTGLLGLAFFLWFAWAVGMTAWKLRFRLLGGFERGYVCSVLAGLLASLVAAMLGDWLIPFIYNTGFPGYRTSVLPWIFMGGLIALEQRQLRTK